MKVYSAGYSGRSYEELVETLESHGVERVADVRSLPSSRREEFSKENLEDSLPRNGIDYRHIPELGGYRDDYRAYAETPEFREALSRLETLARDAPTCFLCLERDPADCHRRHVADALRLDGWTVIHLVEEGQGQATL